jgi:hypothetical protein
MTLEELAHKVNWLWNNCKRDKQVVVTLDSVSVGGRAFANVTSVDAGFDWEANQIRIDVDRPIIEKNKDRDVPMPKAKASNGYICRACGYFVRKDDKYCSTCGQNVEGVMK